MCNRRKCQLVTWPHPECHRPGPDGFQGAGRHTDSLSRVDYYKSVLNRMGRLSAWEFVRLYMIPGMQHCGNGPGAGLQGHSVPGAGRIDRCADPRTSAGGTGSGPPPTPWHERSPASRRRLRQYVASGGDSKCPRANRCLPRDTATGQKSHRYQLRTQLAGAPVHLQPQEADEHLTGCRGLGIQPCVRL